MFVEELTNPEVAGQMKIFIKSLCTQKSFVGVSMFAVFAIMKRMRLRVWYGMQCEEVLQAYAPSVLTTGRITASAALDAIACRISRDEVTDKRRLHVVEDLHITNHWIACTPGGVKTTLIMPYSKRHRTTKQKCFNQGILP